MPKKPADKPVTEATFNKEIKTVHQRMDSMDKKIDNVALALVKTQEDVKQIQETVFTKADANLILNKLDDISLKIETSSRKATVQDHRINELESKLSDHEKRLVTLESK